QHAPGAGQPEPESGEHIGKRTREDNFPEKLVVSRTHRLRCPDPNFLDRLHSGPRVEDNRKSGSKCDEQHGWKISEAEPEDEKRRISQSWNRIADADQRQEKILGQAIAADDDAETDSD